jgi:hypothetical protein
MAYPMRRIVTHIMERKDQEKSSGDHLSQRAILEIHDALAEAIRDAQLTKHSRSTMSVRATTIDIGIFGGVVGRSALLPLRLRSRDPGGFKAPQSHHYPGQ